VGTAPRATTARFSYQTAEPGAELKAAQIASNARAYTMLISCTANEEDKGKK
jgi:hypothetical protein